MDARAARDLLGRLLREDRAAHAEVPPVGSPAYRALREADRARRAAAERALDALGASAAPEDWYGAAWLFNHGEAPEDARRAYDLARAAAEAGHTPARWLTAAAYDRWRMYRGERQRYGTQIVPDGRGYRLWDLDPETSDAERARWDVPPLAVQRERAEALTRTAPQPPMALAPEWLRTARARWEDETPPGVDSVQPLLTPMTPSGHTDTFARDHLPPKALWPDFLIEPGGPFDYPERLNAAVELLDRPAEAHPERTLIHTSTGPITYGAFQRRVNRIAHVLVDEMHLEPGNRVLLRGRNDPDFAACWFAVVKAGGVAVATMPLLRAFELDYTIRKAHVSHALCAHDLADELAAARNRSPFLRRVRHFGDAAADGLDALAKDKPDTFEAIDTAADDVALIAFTSGTTGQAKATAHFHRDVLAICDAFPASCLDVSERDVFTGSPPLAFTFGLGGLLLFPMRAGASLTFAEQPGVDGMLETIQRHRATVCFTSPTAYRALLSATDRYDLSSLRQCVSAGETLPAATFEAWERKTGLRLIDGIGSTEMLHIFVSACDADQRPGTTGKAVLGYEARVVDKDGREVPDGTPGLLAVRGPTGCRYLDDPDRQRQYVRDGWNYPGDTYFRDADGYFHYLARADDMIVSGGYNIAGPQVESALLQHPAVAECGVIGVPDEARGQVVKAFVVLRPGFEAGDAMARELQDFVKAEIAPYKYPRAVEFRDALPRTQTGKLQRFRLREE